MSDLYTQTLIRELNQWRKRLERKLFTEGLDRVEVADLAFLNDRLGVQCER
jgi:hypothetical protein